MVFTCLCPLTRNTETSVLCSPVRAIPSTLMHMRIPLLASFHLSPVNPEIIIVPTSHIHRDAHLLWKTKTTQTDHHFKQELLHYYPHQCQDVITLILALIRPMDPLISMAPVSTIPMDTVVMSTIPMDTIAVDTVPVGTVPMDTIPMGTIPMAVSMTMDPVTHHPIANVPKITITHHLGNQRKEVQVKGTFPSHGDKLDVFTDSLH